MSQFYLRDLRLIAVRLVLAVSISMLCVAGSARAGLVINLTNGGGTAPANMAGGGDLMTIAAEAAGVWERAFANTPELWVLNLSIGWDDLALGNGQFDQTTQGGNPNLITSGRVRLNNSGNVEFFADPTPWNDVEYGHYETYDRDFGTGLINIGRAFSDPTGDAVGRVDLLTIVLHEIGHGLGLNSDYDGYQEQRDSFFLPIEPPTPFASFYVQLGISDHLFDGDFPNALMIAIENPGVRKRVSGLDILANAQLSRVATPNLDPYAVPEPATWVLTSLAMIAMAMHRCSKRTQAINE